MAPRKFFLNGSWRSSQAIRSIRSPFDSAVAGDVFLASPGDVDEAIGGAERAFAATRRLSSFERSEALRKIVRGIEERRGAFADLMTAETGKPVALSRGEVDRTVFTFRTAAQEAERMDGSVLPLDLNLQSRGRFALLRRFPVGPVAAITPFNFPLNLVAHKLAPAFAVGNPVILKPSSSAPLTALLLAEVVESSGYPTGGLSVLSCVSDDAAQLIADERIKLLSFTGSPTVGWHLKSKAGKKKVTLELGGNAGVIVDRDADLDAAIGKILTGGFANAGQSCIAVQRVYVHADVWPAVKPRLVEGVRLLPFGDPRNEQTIVGPMITEAAAMQVEEWIREAVQGGARLLTGGQREGAMLRPTILEAVDPAMNVSCKEVFAPVITVESYASFDDVLERVNASAYGLQAGLFTANLHHMFQAYAALDVGGVIINDVPTYRIDHMPYGGVKDSGFGREGVRYAMEEMTEPKLLAINP